MWIVFEFFAVQVQSAPAYWGGIGFSCVFRWFLRKNTEFSNFRAMYTSSNPCHAEAGTSFRNPKWLTDFSNRVRCTWYLPNWKYWKFNFFEQLVLSICFFLEWITGSKLPYMNCCLYYAVRYCDVLCISCCNCSHSPELICHIVYIMLYYPHYADLIYHIYFPNKYFIIYKNLSINLYIYINIDIFKI